MSFTRVVLQNGLGFVAAVLLTTPVSRAEAPMHTDDAGTLGKGGMKVEGIWSKDDRAKGGELLFGFSPIENLELEVMATRARDDDFKFRGTGFGAKWVPFKTHEGDTGWSLGVRFDAGHIRVTERATSDKFTEREYALTGLASYHFEEDRVLHINLGAVRMKTLSTSDTLGIWGVGYEFPLVAHLQMTAEVFGTEKARPDKAVGLRYELDDGFKISAAVGRGNDRSFGQIGFAWEF